jgi:TPR repeat protein
MRRWLVAFITFAAVLAAVAGGAAAETRVALVIGNSGYRSVGALANPANDAASMGELFKAARFDVVRILNDLGVSELRKALRDFALKAAGADIAVVFYAGHGIEIDGHNYLIPVDAALAHDIDVEDETIDLDRMLQLLEPAKRLKLVILDACRNNPFAGKMQRTIASRAIGRGLGRPEVQTRNTLVAYAARAGSTADDGQGAHSPFTAALLRHLTTPGLDLRIALGNVHDEVLAASNNAQEPFLYGAMGGGTLALVPGSGEPPQQQALLLPPPRIDEQRAAAVEECDLLAASKFDTTRRASVPGVDFDKIDSERTIAACQKALSERPGDARFKFQLARALDKAKIYEKAVCLYREAADADNFLAINALGTMYHDGHGVAKDGAEAVRLYRKACGCRYPRCDVQSRLEVRVWRRREARLVGS